MAELNKEIQAKIIARAWKDEAFRNLLINNPKTALKEFGIEVPQDFKIKVLPEEENEIYFILPIAPSKTKEMELDHLEKVAGGGTWGQGCHSGMAWCKK